MSRGSGIAFIFTFFFSFVSLEGFFHTVLSDMNYFQKDLFGVKMGP